MSPTIIEEMQVEIENELISHIGGVNNALTNEYYKMLTYHMGWSGEASSINASGKRIRPLILLLCSSSGNKDYSWKNALPAAAAVELLHNFSLIHDDIQDNSEMRRNRPSVWKLWGVPQAINAGDGMYALSNLAVSALIQNNDTDSVIKVAKTFNKTCLDLTRGQFMDMSYESQNNLNMKNYWPMITFKTAALISSSTEIGCLLAGGEDQDLKHYRQFGHYLGLSFQVKDDILGIWGQEELTGKSITKDLVTGKKTLPVLYGLKQQGLFAERWSKGNITIEEVPQIAKQLAKEGARKYSEDTVDQLTDMALNYLRIINPQGSAGEELFNLTNRLLKRDT